jgi:hypothetical protein
MAVTVTNKKTSFDADTNPDISVDIGSGTAGAGTQRVILASDQTAVPVTGTFWQATQPVSGTVTATVTPAALTPAAPTASPVGIASAQILASATYKRIELCNTSANTISIGIGSAAVLNSGITMIGPGSSATIDGPITAAINAIASVAASNLAIQSFT